MNKCTLCHGAKCCNYITQAVDTPRSIADFEILLWQLSHRSVQAYKDHSGWYLLIHTPCLHLDGEGRCSIYAERLGICRDYSSDYCEYDAPAEEGFELFFAGYADLLAYCRRRFKSWERRPSLRR